MIKNPEHFVEEVTKYIRENTDIAVLGLSGGADSTLVACLCVEALGKENVYGLHLPYGKVDTDTFNDKSWKLGEKLGINNNLINIEPTVSTLLYCIGGQHPIEENQLAVGNVKSRIRMVCLYAKANILSSVFIDKRIRVIGTGNLSEDFIGYDTKGGDALADFFPIGNLYKSEVYQMLEYFRDKGVITEDLIDRVPSAGLWDGQTDEQELGYSYNEMEPAIRALKGEIPINDVSVELLTFVEKRHIQNKHKHMAPPVFEYDSNAGYVVVDLQGMIRLRLEDDTIHHIEMKSLKQEHSCDGSYWEFVSIPEGMSEQTAKEVERALNKRLKFSSKMKVD